MNEPNIQLYSAGALSYYGDAVLELLTRRHLLESGIGDAGELNRMARAYVTAASQAQGYEKIKSMLTEEEDMYFKRGRNHQANVPKSASVSQYRKATGMETLFAYLHLSGQTERMHRLFDAAFIDDNDNTNTDKE